MSAPTPQQVAEGHIGATVPVSRSTYLRYGCRCSGCREAAAEYLREWRRKREEAK